MAPEEEITHLKDLGQIVSDENHGPSMINYRVDSCKKTFKQHRLLVSCS